MRLRSLLAVTSLLISQASVAAPFSETSVGLEVIPLGEYWAEYGRGELYIESKVEGHVTFYISSRGANAATCNLDGEIVNGKSTLPATVDSSETCEIKFGYVANKIHVEHNAACRAYCGARAEIEHIYYEPPLGCIKGVQNRRSQFEGLYESGLYIQALAAIEKYRRECSFFFGEMHRDSILNDLAITQYHLSRFDDCIDTMKQSRSLAFRTAKELRNWLGGTDFESFSPIWRATHYNMSLCKKARTRNVKRKPSQETHPK